MPPVIYYPAPGVSSYYPSAGYGGQVYDATGRPLYDEADAFQRSRVETPLGGPDFSGSPYQVTGGGAMVVDFGNGDRRTIPACAVLDAERTPDGRPRTIFYRSPVEALVLRAGARGRVQGRPPAGALVCYAADRYGREVLAY